MHRSILVAAALVAAPALAQEVALPVPLEPGQVYELVSENGKETPAKGPEAAPQSYSSTSRIEVGALEGDGFLLSVMVQDYDFSGVEPPMGVVLESLVAMFADRTYEYETDASGMPVRLRGWRELEAEVFEEARRQAEPLIEQRLADEPTEMRLQLGAKIRATLDAMQRQYARLSDAEAAAIFGEDLVLWSYPAGRSLVVGQPVRGAVEVPSPLGDGRLTGIETVELVGVADGIATIERRQVLDEAGTRELLDSIVEMMNLPLDQRRAALSQLAELEMSIEVEQVFLTEVDTGFTREVTQTRTSVLGPAAQSVERKVLTARPAE